MLNGGYCDGKGLRIVSLWRSHSVPKSFLTFRHRRPLKRRRCTGVTVGPLAVDSRQNPTAVARQGLLARAAERCT